MAFCFLEDDMWTVEDEPTRRAQEPSPLRIDDHDADERDDHGESREDTDVEDTLEEEGYGHGV
jgi:hypothetical protein